MGLAIIHWIPDLFTIVLIVLLTRGVSRFIYVMFAAAEQDRLHIPGVYPETAPPTRRLVISCSGSSHSSRRIPICPAANPKRSKASACSSA